MIEYIEIVLRRWIHGDDRQELRIEVRGYGKEYHLNQILYPDDLQSNFDIIWQRVGRELLENIKADQKKE
jgi:hypothetical protein